MEMQTVPHGVWTKLDGLDVEVFHNSGYNIDTEAFGSPNLRVEWSDRG